MTKTFKPLLAASLEEKDIGTVKFPVFVSRKLDGVRVIIKNGVVLSRNMKPIRNKHVQKLFGIPALEGVDGELIVGAPNLNETYNNTVSGVMSEDGEPNVFLHAFDIVDESEEFVERLEVLRDLSDLLPYTVPANVILYDVAHTAEQLLQREAQYLEEGYEGAMIRDPHGKYKMGRSTLREGILLKLKRFLDSEAEIVEMTELLSNQNAATIDALGHTTRSGHKDNLVPMGTMGSLKVRDIHTGVEFEIGTGFDQAARDWFWSKRNDLSGVLVKYKYFPVGVKDRPRFPVYIGLRDPNDM